jgi:drug/metabolite transporter (DMT)-like permease
MLGIALALGASLCWGISDFLGGIQSRRFSALSVLIVSQPIGAVLALLVALAFGDDGLTPEQFLVAALGGAAVLGALGAFYRAMALGSVSVVATIGALGVVVPVVGGIAMGETPEPVQLAGALLAIGGVLFVAWEPDPEWRHANRASVGLAALAALGFGVFFLAIDEAASHDAAWTIVAARVGGVSTLAVAAIVLRPSIPRARGKLLAALLVIGVFDVAANSLYAVATTKGLLPLVAVGGSLYSAVTVILAWSFLGERLARAQLAGVVVALGGVVLIAAGA